MDDIIEPDLHVTFSTKFRAIRVIENRIIPTTWSLKSYIIHNDESEDEDASSRFNFKSDLVLRKVNFWLQNVINDGIMFSRDNEFALNAFTTDDGKQAVDNRLIILPSDPGDGDVCEILHSKLNAFGGEFVLFEGIQLFAEEMSGIGVEFTGHGEFNLPTMEEWVGERAYHSKPWWARDDASTYDLIPDEDADITEAPSYAYSLDFLADIMEIPEEVNAKLFKPEFKPVVIDGKNDQNS